MNVWLYDENGWPSGFVGGELLKNEEYLAPYLEKRNEGFFDVSAYAVFGKTPEGKRRLKKGEEPIDGIYENVYMMRSPANTDILNPDVVSKFIEMTHEEYYSRFSHEFGKTIKGFFTDEPQYFRYNTPYTPEVEDYFSKTYGESVSDGIIHLFYDGEEDYPFRVKYYKALNFLYTNNFYKRLYDWCNEHNCMLTGHSVEETFFHTQMWGGAGCTPSYEYEHIPGIDNLCLNGVAKLSARQIGSLAGQLGKKQVLTETFGCCGYDVTPKELKAIAEKQYVHGVNLMCHHLYPYSIAGQGKTDHPPVFGAHSTWWKQFSKFNSYFTRLGYLLANSKALSDCVVISPMSSIYLNYFRLDERKSFVIDEQFEKLQKELNKKSILYDIADENILSKYGSVDGKALVVGEKRYSYVIVPYVLTLYKSTCDLLEKYVKSGGKICVINMPEYVDGEKRNPLFLTSNVDLEEISSKREFDFASDGKTEYTYRDAFGERFAYLVNVEKTASKVIIPKGYSSVDILSLKRRECSGEVCLNAGESLFLVEEAEKDRRFTAIQLT